MHAGSGLLGNSADTGGNLLPVARRLLETLLKTFADDLQFLVVAGLIQ